MAGVASREALEKKLREEIQAQFDKVRIIDVRIGMEDEEQDIVKVDVIFEGRVKDLDARKMSGVTGDLRSRLPTIGMKAFPIVSFISQREAGARSVAAA